ncbi:MAG: hypothetical protein EAS52_11575 [Parapedobacter sp.]|nr:MAG: hypothetical protein EAS52_11575 [Parapedobacter sp.]
MTPNTKNAYIETKQIVRGDAGIKPEFVPLVEWIDETYGVKTLNITYYEDDAHTQTPHIHGYVESEEEWNKLYRPDGSFFDINVLDAIARKFCGTITQQGLAKSNSLLTRLFGQRENGRYLTDNRMGVSFGIFANDAKMETRWKIDRSQLDGFIQSLDNSALWTVEFGYTAVPTFFVLTDDQIQEFNQPAILSAWSDRFYEFVTPFDEFNYFGRDCSQIAIDSKENFDNNFSSNWYYYFK